MILVSACLAGVNCRYDGQNNGRDDIKEWVREGKALLICPEQLGGLSTPRTPAEIVGGTGEDVLAGRARVIDYSGQDVTEAFLKGAEEVARLAQLVKATKAVLKESSPSCGSSRQYDGSFQGRKRDGCGITAALLRQWGITVHSEECKIKKDGESE